MAMFVCRYLPRSLTNMIASNRTLHKRTHSCNALLPMRARHEARLHIPLHAGALDATLAS